MCVWVPVCMFVFTKASHIPRFSASQQHTQTGVRTGERGRESPDCGAWPCCANITPFLSLSLSTDFSLALIQCLSASPLVSLYSPFPTVPNTEGLFVIQSRKCNWSQICPALLFDIIPPLFLWPPITMRLASNGTSPDTVEQAELRQDGSRDVLDV